MTQNFGPLFKTAICAAEKFWFEKLTIFGAMIFLVVAVVLVAAAVATVVALAVVFVDVVLPLVDDDA